MTTFVEMEIILRKFNMEGNISRFKEEKISPDIISKLSLYELLSLGVTDRSSIMKLRMECINYGSNRFRGTFKRTFEIPEEVLVFLLDTQFKINEIAKLLSASESTIYRRMRHFNLTKRHLTDISDEHLDSVIQDVTEEFPRCGEEMVRHILLQKREIKVTRSRTRESLHRTDENGIRDRSRRRLQRRMYNVNGVNHMWHIDTNHKLIRWNFIIVGGIDGFSRLVTFLNCRDNNRARTVFDCFLQGVTEFGLPLRVRSDKGLENCLVADYMIEKRGSNRGSMITGKSCHNQRIERLWRDVFEGVLCYYYDLFYFMEEEGFLDISKDSHMCALHHVFLPKINEKLNIWRNAWGNHRVRTVHTSPLRLFTAGRINNPLDFNVVDIENYGVEGNYLNVMGGIENSRPVLDSPVFVVDETRKEELNLICPTSWTSSEFGIDMYLKAVQIIERSD